MSLFSHLIANVIGQCISLSFWKTVALWLLTTFCPNIYKRYVDDIFVTFNPHDHLKKFAEYMNTKHPHIKFTFEHEYNFHSWMSKYVVKIINWPLLCIENTNLVEFLLILMFCTNNLRIRFSLHFTTVLEQLPLTKIAPPSPNPKTNPNPNTNPNQGAIFLGSNCPDTLYYIVILILLPLIKNFDIII